MSVPMLHHLDVVGRLVCPSDSQGYMSGSFGLCKVQLCSEGLRSSMCEVRWTGHGETKLQTEETLLYSGKNEEHHEAGVEILLSKKAANNLLEWNPVSDRIITARFESRFKRVSIIMCYASTNTSEEEDKNSFYAQLQSVPDKIPNRDMLILMGDMNAMVGADNTDREREMGRHGLGEMNENG